jgi:peptidoglycan hydrolase CwlO-like protein
MTETTTMNIDLDLLAERVEKAAALIQRMRGEQQKLERERDDLARRLQEADQKLQGQDVSALLAELQTLRKEQREWQGERRDVGARIEALVKKLERLEE